MFLKIITRRCKSRPFKIESDVSAVLVRNRRAKVVNQSFSVEILGCVGHWGGQYAFSSRTRKNKKQYNIRAIVGNIRVLFGDVWTYTSRSHVDVPYMRCDGQDV